MLWCSNISISPQTAKDLRGKVKISPCLNIARMIYELGVV